MADLDNNGEPELLWRNSTSGLIVAWFFSGRRVVFQSAYSAGLNWKIAGMGDMNGDGLPELEFVDPATGWMVIWFMVGPSVVNQAAVPVTPGWTTPDAELAAIGR